MQKYRNKNKNLEYRLENSLILQGSRKYISRKIIKKNKKIVWWLAKIGMCYKKIINKIFKQKTTNF